MKVDDGANPPLVFARAGWTGTQRHAVHVAADAQRDWEGLAASIRGALSLGMSGVPLTCAQVPGTYGGQARDLAPWLVDAEINRDSNLRLQYLAGMGLNSYQNAGIYDDMLKYRRFPENLFVGAESERQYLRQQFGGFSGP